MYRSRALKMVVHYFVTAEVFLALLLGSVMFTETYLRYGPTSPVIAGDHPHDPPPSPGMA